MTSFGQASTTLANRPLGMPTSTLKLRTPILPAPSLMAAHGRGTYPFAGIWTYVDTRSHSPSTATSCQGWTRHDLFGNYASGFGCLSSIFLKPESTVHQMPCLIMVGTVGCVPAGSDGAATRAAWRASQECEWLGMARRDQPLDMARP